MTYDESVPRRTGIAFNYRTAEQEAELMEAVRKSPDMKFLYAKSCSDVGAWSMAGRFQNSRQPDGFRVNFTPTKSNDDVYLSYVLVQFDPTPTPSTSVLPTSTTDTEVSAIIARAQALKSRYLEGK